MTNPVLHSAATASPCGRRPRKWIAARLRQLDPEIDYEEIWKLTAAYSSDQLMVSLGYVLSMLNVVLHESDAAVMHHTRKMYERPNARELDTNRAFYTWWTAGIDAPETRRSIAAVNQIHARYAVKFPASFANNDSFLYTLCYNATLAHDLMRYVGLPGYTEKQQVAAVRYHQRLAQELKVYGIDGSERPVAGFPDTFAGVLAFMRRHEARQALPAFGSAPALSFLLHFETRWFPPILRPLARRWVLALLPDHLIKGLQLRRPAPPVAWLLRKATLIYFIASSFRADPAEAFLDTLSGSKARADARVRDETFRTHFPNLGTCPGLASSRSAERPGAGRAGAVEIQFDDTADQSSQ